MDFQKSLDKVRNKVSGHRQNLYKTLGAVYAFRMEAWGDDEDGYITYVKKQYEDNGWSWTEATKSNYFLSAVRLAFESDEDNKETNAAACSKYAGALAWLEHKNIGNDAPKSANKPEPADTCTGLGVPRPYRPPASPGNHRSDGNQAGHAQTFNLDHSMGPTKTPSLLI